MFATSAADACSCTSSTSTGRAIPFTDSCPICSRIVENPGFTAPALYCTTRSCATATGAAQARTTDKQKRTRKRCTTTPLQIRGGEPLYHIPEAMRNGVRSLHSERLTPSGVGLLTPSRALRNKPASHCGELVWV